MPPPHPTQPPGGPATLLQRLDAIGRCLRDGGQALALIGLGSVGCEQDRLDAWSDLDFFVIVEPGCKHRFLEDLGWLAAAAPLAWHFRNTVDGHKALMHDGVFCEFAVFEPAELDAIPFAPGRVVWKRADVADGMATPRRPLPPREPPDETWIVGEALSNLLVGLQRFRRGERLSAMRLVQVFAVDRLIELDALRHPESNAGSDPFARERRLEARAPALAAELPRLVPGIDATPQAAREMLEALRRRGALLAEPVVERIQALAA
jgi:hypothetical protein